MSDTFKTCENNVFNAVRILSLAKFLLNIVYYQLYWKDENKEKEAGMAHF